MLPTKHNNLKTVLAIVPIFFALCSQANTVSVQDIPAERLYETAFKLIVEGNYGEAYDRLNEVVGKYPATVYARFAEDRKRRLEELNLYSISRKKIDQSGRIESIVFSTLYSTWLGVGTARLLNAENEKAMVAGMMMGAPAGLLTSLALTRNAGLSKGQAGLINFGGYWGTWQGYGLAVLLDNSNSEKTMIGGAMAGGLLGILTTSALTRKINPSLGDVSLINYGGLWGTWFSFWSGIYADIDIGSDKFLGLVLLGGNLGTIAMASLSKEIEISFIRASLINLSGIIGTLFANGWIIISKSGNEKSAFAAMIAGGIFGLVAGIYGTAGFDARYISQESDPEKLSWGMDRQHQEINSNEIRANFLCIQF